MTETVVHFICRGNSFRSIIAEAYLNSLRVTRLRATSSGTTGAAHRAANMAAYTATLGILARNGIREFAKAGYGDQLTQSLLAGADVVVCLNQRVRDECQRLVTLPPGTRVWSVADIGEPGRVAHTEAERNLCRQAAYHEIAQAVRRLLAELRPDPLSASGGERSGRPSGGGPGGTLTWRSHSCHLRSSGPAVPAGGAPWWPNSIQRVAFPVILPP